MGLRLSSGEAGDSSSKMPETTMDDNDLHVATSVGEGEDKENCCSFIRWDSRLQMS